jgi:hypothetical protein
MGQRDRDTRIIRRFSKGDRAPFNEFLQEHSKVEEQQATITQLKKDFGATIAPLTACLDEQASQIQKVSAQLEVRRFATGRIRRGGPALQVVAKRPYAAR